MHPEPKKILVIHFGQLGDVVLGLPALRAIRDGFPNAHLTALVGSATCELVTLAGLFDSVIPVDRVRLLNANKFSSSVELIRFAFGIRRKCFDLVIDLHSLPETNLLGYFSGANSRLFADREGRSLNFLSNYFPKPPPEDKKIHLSENYLKVLSPLGVFGTTDKPFAFEAVPRSPTPNNQIVGLNPGAGNPSRRWPVESFVRLAHEIVTSTGAEIEVLIGPEDTKLVEVFQTEFGPASIHQAPGIQPLISALRRFRVLVSNDTGPAHLAAILGIPIVLLRHATSPDRYLPLANDLVVHRGGTLEDIEVADVCRSVRGLLASVR